MSTELAQKQPEDNRVALQKYTNYLQQQPPKNEIQVNAMAGNSKYLPISFIEMQLDELFFGMWSTDKFQYSQVGNEMVGSIELKVYHPIAKEWITRTGAAGVMIQFKKGSDVTDYNQKIANTLVKDFPHLKAECLKNAARSLGKIFGRDLNRKFEDSYTPLIKEKPINE